MISQPGLFEETPTKAKQGLTNLMETFNDLVGRDYYDIPTLCQKPLPEQPHISWWNVQIDHNSEWFMGKTLGEAYAKVSACYESELRQSIACKRRI